jgi:anti-sigma regulatory factor (Ser/Thr protein kinase)
MRDARMPSQPAAARTFRVRRGELGVLRDVAQWCRSATQGRSWSSALRSDIDLALHEAISNVIRHGIADDDEHEIDVSIASEDTGARVVIRDDANAFDPLATTPAPPAASLEDAVPGGRGILLLRAMTSELRYAYADEHNVLTLKFPLESAGT